MLAICKRSLMCLGVLLVVLGVIFVIPIKKVEAINQNEVSTELESYINQYVGTRWTGDFYGKQCKGFANLIFRNIFGIYIGPYPNGENYRLNVNAGAHAIGILGPGSMSLDNAQNLLSQGLPGDYIQVRRNHGGSHSMILVGANDDGIEVFDCNSDGNLTVKNYFISWSQFCSSNSAMSLYRADDYESAPSDTERPTIGRCWSEFEPANNYIAVHAEAWDNVGVDHIRFAVWADGHEQRWVDVPFVDGVAQIAMGFPYEVDGNWNVHAYAYDAAGNESDYAEFEVHTIDYYQKPPTISNVRVTDVNATGYTIACDVTDSNGVKNVYFPTWTQNNGQDDLKPDWPAGTRNGDTWSFRVKDSDHNYEKGNYVTHIYADDNRNNRTKSTEVITRIENNNTVVASTDVGEKHYALIDDAVSWDEAKRRCEEMGGHLVTIKSAEENKTVVDLIKQGGRNDYWIGLTDEEKEGTFKWVTGENLGTYKPWRTESGEPNDYKGREDYCNINKSDGFWNDNYNTNIMGFVCEMSAKAPEITDVKISEEDESGYTVSCKVTSEIGINRVQMPSWTENNGQDDLIGEWPIASVSGDTYTYRVNTAEHNNEIGRYHTHIYAYDNAGRQACTELNDIQVAAYNKAAKTETYEGNQYLRIDANCTWAEAKARSNELGGHLVTITSQEEQDVVSRLVEGANCSAYWMGLTDEKQDKAFAWITGETYHYKDDFYSYRNWSKDQPSYVAGGKNEDYGEIRNDGTWNDCSGDTRRGYICEIEGSQPPAQSMTYNGHVYQLMEETMSWTEAKAKCEVLGGHLATITTQEENDAVTALKNKGYSDSYWIGLNDEASVGNYTWVTGEGVTYNNWNPGEPNNEGVERYVEIIPGSKWNNQTNGAHRGFICEKNYQEPVITNVQIADKNSNGYTISCTVTGSTNIDRVQFPTWTGANEQDDMVSSWLDNPVIKGTKSGDTYTFRVNTEDHNDETGVYYTDIYAFDSSGGVAAATGNKVSIINEASIKATENLNGNKYYLFEDGMTWAEARNACQKIGGHLVTITSQEEQDVVVRLKKKGSRDNYWIGLTGKKDTGFKWINNEQYNFSAWDNEQPDNNGDREDKASLWREGQWNDANENTKYGYICEVDATLIPTAAIAFNGHDYQLYEEQMTWQEAKEKCEAMGGKIVSIGSIEEANAVTGLLNKGIHDWYWLGAKRAEDKRFAWSNGDAWTCELYMENQPDNNKGNQDVLRTNKSGQWDDVESTMLYGFICEKETSDIQISNVKISNETGAGYTVSCTIKSTTPINRVQFPTWTINQGGEDGQDDIMASWQTNAKASGTKVGDTYTYRVKDTDHNEENGVYRTHIYVYDTAGNVKTESAPDVDLQNKSIAISKESYNEHQYVLIDDKLSWDEARQKCLALGGHMVTINTKAEQDFVNGFLQKGERGSYWIGLTDVKDEGTFKWITDERYTYKNWGTGEPNNDNDQEEFAEMSRNGKWNDNSAQRKTGYICEIEPTTAVVATRTTAGKKYQLVDGSYSWDEAKTKAENMGGHLVTITSTDEQQIVSQLMQNGFSSDYYIGALGSTDVNKKQNFSWITGEPWSYQGDWSAGQPDNDQGIQNYIRLNAKTGKWDDINAGHTYGFICEKDMIPVESVKLNIESKALAVGESYQLTAETKPSNAKDKTITWRSEKEAVATVDKNGLVTAVGAGQTTITATSNNGKQAICKVIVSKVEATDRIQINGVCDKKTVAPRNEVTITVNLENYNISKEQIATMQIEIPNKTKELTYVADSKKSLITDGEFSANDAIIFTYLPLTAGDNILPKETKELFSFQMQVNAEIREDKDVELPMTITIGNENDEAIMQDVQKNIIVSIRKVAIKKGDLSGDGKIDIMDARKAKRCAMKEILLTDDELKAADIDNNGKVDIMEARKIKRAAMKEIVLE